SWGVRPKSKGRGYISLTVSSSVRENGEEYAEGPMPQDWSVDIQQTFWQSTWSSFTSAQTILGSLLGLVIAVVSLLLSLVNLRDRIQKRERPGETPIRGGQ